VCLKNAIPKPKSDERRSNDNSTRHYKHGQNDPQPYSHRAEFVSVRAQLANLIIGKRILDARYWMLDTRSGITSRHSSFVKRFVSIVNVSTIVI
jgi:hypothetical protein